MVSEEEDPEMVLVKPAVLAVVACVAIGVPAASQAYVISRIKRCGGISRLIEKVSE